jgi:hypothetical protein
MPEPIALSPETAKDDRICEEAKSIVAFLCSDKPAQATRLLETSKHFCAKTEGIALPFQLRTLRREIIRECVEICWDEIHILILSYGSSDSHHQGITSSLVPVERVQASLDQTVGQLNLLQRLVLLMTYREGYGARECALMLKTSDWLVYVICEHSLFSIGM